MKRKLLWAGGIIVGLLVVGVVVLFLTLNGIVRSAVQSAATQNLQVQTTVGGASIKPFSGNVGLSNVEVASPKGFTAPKMFSLGNVAVDVSYGQLFGDTKHIDTIAIVDPVLVVEQAGGKINIKALADSLQTGEKTPAPAEQKPMKLVIGQLDVRGAKVEVRPNMPGLNESYTMEIPPLTMKNIGNADGNQTGEEVGRIITDLARALAEKAVDSGKLPPEIQTLLKLNVEEVKAEIGKRAQEQIDKVKDQVGKEMEKGLGDVLKKMEQKEEKRQKEKP